MNQIKFIKGVMDKNFNFEEYPKQAWKPTDFTGV
jgi:hypothetical protein